MPSDPTPSENRGLINDMARRLQAVEGLRGDVRALSQKVDSDRDDARREHETLEDKIDRGHEELAGQIRAIVDGLERRDRTEAEEEKAAREQEETDAVTRRRDRRNTALVILSMLVGLLGPAVGNYFDLLGP